VIKVPKKDKDKENSQNRLDLIGKAHNERKEDEIRIDRMEDYLK
jgi:hypothetical protein